MKITLQDNFIRPFKKNEDFYNVENLNKNREVKMKDNLCLRVLLVVTHTLKKLHVPNLFISLV